LRIFSLKFGIERGFGMRTVALNVIMVID